MRRRGRGFMIAASGRLSSGSTSLRARLLPPQVDHAGKPLRLLRGEVAGLGDVALDVVELPHVVGERCVGIESVVVHRAEGMKRHGFPTIVIDAARAEHLEVLRVVRAGGAARSPSTVARLAPSTRDCSMPSITVGRRDAGELEDRRRDVDRVRELRGALRPLRRARASARCTDRRRRPRGPRASSA